MTSFILWWSLYSQLLVGSRWNRFHVESYCCPSIYLHRKLLLFAGSRWNLFHVDPDGFMPRNNIAVIHIPQRPTFKMTKSIIFYHNIRHLLNNKDAYILVNDSRSPIPQVQDKKERYTDRDIKRADSSSRFQRITGQPIKQILHAVDNNILHLGG